MVDTQLPDPEGVRRIKVKTTKHHWGFIWRNTDTDDNGCWKINHRYNVRRTKTKIVFKDRVSDRISIRAVMSALPGTTLELDLPNALKPVKNTWRLRNDDRIWNDQCLLIDNPTFNIGVRERTFNTATVNNAYHEFFDDHSSLPHPDGRVRILLHTINSGWNSAPMLHRMDVDQVNINDLAQWVLTYGFPVTGSVAGLIDIMKPDMTLFFGDGRPSDRVKRITYHETAHISQYARFGPQWWKEEVAYTIRVALTNQASPYGDGTLTGSGRPELIEGMATSIENYMADLQYELSHSRGGNAQFNRYINNGERLLFWVGVFTELCQGLI